MNEHPLHVLLLCYLLLLAPYFSCAVGENNCIAKCSLLRAATDQYPGVILY